MNGELRPAELNLPSGLQVRLASGETTPLVSIWLGYRVGSRNDPPSKTGLSHFLEHMVCGGEAHSGEAHSNEAHGPASGLFNARTSLDYTCYTQTLPETKLKPVLARE